MTNQEAWKAILEKQASAYRVSGATTAAYTLSQVVKRADGGEMKSAILQLARDNRRMGFPEDAMKLERLVAGAPAIKSVDVVPSSDPRLERARAAVGRGDFDRAEYLIKLVKEERAPKPNALPRILAGIKASDHVKARFTDGIGLIDPSTARDSTTIKLVAGELRAGHLGAEQAAVKSIEPAGVAEYILRFADGRRVGCDRRALDTILNRR